MENRIEVMRKLKARYFEIFKTHPVSDPKRFDVEFKTQIEEAIKTGKKIDSSFKKNVVY